METHANHGTQAGHAFRKCRLLDGAVTDLLFEVGAYHEPVRVKIPLAWKPSPSDDWSSLSDWEFVKEAGFPRSAADAVAGNWEPETTTTTTTIYARYLNDGDDLDGESAVTEARYGGARQFNVRLPVEYAKISSRPVLIHGLQTGQVQFASLDPLPA